jgi:acetamidase/formamidase
MRRTRASHSRNWTIPFNGDTFCYSYKQALSLSSIAVDFRAGEAVDLTQVVVGYIPKEIFVD